MKTASSRQCGIILICGPTGSGKSWTLFSTLMSLDRKRMKVITIEDPVEYEGEGLTQIEITGKKFGFADALKSCLRLDPDVLMIGEIRDQESADLAFKASSTGHLVLTTLHTNGALEAIDRLRGLGIADDLLASNIRLVCGQTLVRRLCENCRLEVWEGRNRVFARNPLGCDDPRCNLGGRGRIPSGMRRASADVSIACRASGLTAKVIKVFVGGGHKVFQIELRSSLSRSGYFFHEEAVDIGKFDQNHSPLLHISSKRLGPRIPDRRAATLTIVTDDGVKASSLKVCNVGEQVESVTYQVKKGTR